MRRLEVILKLAEVCNIACTYCYYFLSGDDRFESRPKYVTDRTVDGLVGFINAGFADGRFDEAKIIFHGGEPLMVGVDRLEAICEAISGGLDCPFSLNMTTNAVLINARWIDTFSKWGVNICVSLDGPADVHDRQRVDKRGRGTHSKVVEGLGLLQAAHRDGRLTEPAVLAVVDPESDPVRTYDFLVHEMGVRELDFLMPDCTWDSPGPPAEAVARYMEGLMARWLTDDDPDIRIRTLRSVLSLWANGRSYLSGFGSKPALVMTVGSDGTIDTDDFLKPCGVDVVATERHIGSATFADIFESELAYRNSEALARIPEQCSGCAFEGVCRGGQATHRFSRARGFNNPSIYCDAQQRMFRLGLSHLVATGMPVAQAMVAAERVAA